MKKALSYTVGGNVISAAIMEPLWRTVWRFLRKLNIKLPCDQLILLLGIYPDKTVIQKDICTPMFIAALFTIIETWKQPKCH